MLSHLDVVMTPLWFLSLAAFPLGGQFGCMCENTQYETTIMFYMGRTYLLL